MTLPIPAIPRVVGGAARAALLSALLCGAGCLHVTQQLTILPNGAATLRLHYSIPEEAVPPLSTAVASALGDSADPESAPWWRNRSACATYLKEHGLPMERYQAYDGDRRRHTVIEARIENLNAALGKGPLAGVGLEETEAGNLKMTVRLPERPEGELDLQRLPDGMVLQLRISVPTEIVETTGTRPDDQTAAWTVTNETLKSHAWPKPSVVFAPLRATPPADPDPRPKPPNP